MSDRFYCPDPPDDGRLVLHGDEARHLIRVRRVEVGQLVEVFDGRGLACLAEVEEHGRDRVLLRYRSPVTANQGPRCSLTLATAVPKGDRFDWLIEKATELGVDRLIPMVTERSVVDPRSSKMDRLRRAVIEASKQCRRDRLMDLDAPTPWSNLMRSARQPIRLMAHPCGQGMASIDLRPKDQPVILAIGPEGGFAPDEVEQAAGEGWQLVGLGPTTLRVETAALAGASIIFALAEVDPEETIEKEGKGA